MNLIVISGTSSGLGKKLSLFFLMEGYSVLGISRKKPNFLKFKNYHHINCDISKFKELDSKIKLWSKKNKFKKINFILSASILGPNGGIIKTKLSNWVEVFKVNLLGNLQIIKSFLVILRRKKNVNFFFLAGGGSANARPEFSSYSVAKTAVVREVENLQIEFRNFKNFNFFAVAPGAIKTPMLSKVIKSGEKIKKITPIEKSFEFFLFMIKNVNRNISFKGRFIHVNDTWKKNVFKKFKTNKWYLRRIN